MKTFILGWVILGYKVFLPLGSTDIPFELESFCYSYASDDAIYTVTDQETQELPFQCTLDESDKWGYRLL